MRLLLTIILALCIASCGQPESELRSAHLHSLYQADPKLDAQRAIAARDYRFIAVMNHDLHLPMNIARCLVEKFGYRVISNASLPYMSYEFQLHGAIAPMYANWYNYEILAELEAINQYPCPATLQDTDND